jgi:hypothetical protein
MIDSSLTCEALLTGFIAMPRIVLEGGTDIADVLLFGTDDLPTGKIDDNRLSRLIDSNRAIRMPTGGDGGYLLHLYVDDEIPDDTKQYCVADNTIESEFNAGSGRIAFGGAESACSDFSPNANIRSDAEIPPGRYRAIAYRTEFPDDLVASAIEHAIGPEGERAMAVPGKIVLGTIAATVLFVVVGINVNAMGLLGALVLVGGGVTWYKSYTGSAEYRELEAKQKMAQIDYPSIVIRLVKQ